MTLSIVIPVYNEAERLPACLEAIAAQTVRPDEVIVVDNNSTDGSAKLAAGYPFVKVVNEPLQGIVHARSRGFNTARGDIIGRIDADSVLPEHWVEHVKRFYSQADRSDSAFTGAASFNNVSVPRAVGWLYNLLAFDFNRWLIGHPTLWGSNMALTRRQWRAVRTHVCNRTRLHEDLDLAIHLHRAGYRIYYDRRFYVPARLGRIDTTRQELWDYLQWWPNTLRRHHKPLWWLAWLFGALLLYALTPLLSIGQSLRRLPGMALGTDRI
jgi:glycosyltransferase involved in cell wall biosynthesis